MAYIEDDKPESLAVAIESLHNCKATYVESITVKESFEGNPVWEGSVHKFSLEGNPAAQIAYAWTSPIEGSKKRRVFAVLEIAPIKSAVDAVRASIIQQQRTRHER